MKASGWLLVAEPRNSRVDSQAIIRADIWDWDILRSETGLPSDVGRFFKSLNVPNKILRYRPFANDNVLYHAQYTSLGKHQFRRSVTILSFIFGAAWITT